MKTKINWQKVDWTRKLADIAADFGCHPDSAAKAKSRLGLTKPISRDGLDMAKRKVSEKRAKAARILRAKELGKCIKCFHNDVEESPTCETCKKKMRANWEKYSLRKKTLKSIYHDSRTQNLSFQTSQAAQFG